MIVVEVYLAMLHEVVVDFFLIVELRRLRLRFSCFNLALRPPRR
jgi:hypothetical protein